MPLMAGAGAAAAASAASAAGVGAFGYNRANYMFDSGLRFQRYMAGYGFAEAQAAQYREDIRDLTEQTCAKQDLYHALGVIFYVLNFQLIMAGRLGVHGPSPPEWILGLYWVNISSALMFLSALTWLALHAGARATAGSATLLTRSVRLPIPTPKMMDRARKTGNSFEKERATDIFRVPFAVPAPKDANPEDDVEKGAAPGKKPRRMPKWHTDEMQELHRGENGAALTATSTPEHFELYRGLQQEWAAHDCYARIGILYFLSCWMSSVSLYSQCHCFGELRAIWPAWTVSAIFCTAHYCVLQADIVEQTGLQLEKVVVFIPMITVLGMSLDYSVATPSTGLVAFIYFLSFICYFINLMWSFRMYQLASLHTQAELPDAMGGPWCPSEWQLPRAFVMSYCIVSPPKALEPGVPTCLQLEMKADKGANGSSLPQKKARETGTSLYPWRLFRGALVTYTGLWVFIIVGRVFEICNGERQMLKQTGRVIRWPAHMQPWFTPWTREGTRNEWAHTGGSDRRLQQTDGNMNLNDQKVAAMAQRLIARIGSVAEALDTKLPLPRIPAPLRANVAWPADFQPSILASLAGEGRMAALSSMERKGAILQVSELDTSGKAVLSQFILGGIDELGSLLGASWAASGLIVTTTTGAVAECPGLPKAGVWPCSQVGTSLPSGGSTIKSAVAVRLPEGRLRAAINFEEEQGLLILDLDLKSHSWIPSGEVQLPLSQGSSHSHHLSFDPKGDELLVSSSHDGGALKWRVGESDATEPVIVATPQAAAFGRVWHAACGLGGGQVAHLASQAVGSKPELLLSSSA